MMKYATALGVGGEGSKAATCLRFMGRGQTNRCAMRNGLFIMALLLAGCAGDQYGLGGKPADVPREVVRLGVIESVTPIEMDASSGGGASVGGVFGQVGGASTGGGRGTVLGGTLGQQSDIATKP